MSNKKYERYARQIKLEQIDQAGQNKLGQSKVLVVGAGGLGSPILYYLAAAGIGTIGIIDYDTVSESNLNRQILHNTDDLGRMKIDSAYEKLKKLNPEIDIIKYEKKLCVDNIEEIIAEYDIVVDAVDNFQSRFLVSDCCYLMKKPLIEGAVNGFDGIILPIIPDITPCYRCLYPEPPDVDIISSYKEAGILGAIAGTIGSLQALETIKLILNIGDLKLGKIIIFDGIKLNFREIEWKKNCNCKLCSEKSTINSLFQYNI